MNKPGKQSQEPQLSGPLGTSGLMERLLYVQKRKRAFDGAAADRAARPMDPFRRRLEVEQQGRRGR